ncbi:MAG: lipopolysaccharide heptosyltransferase RfaC [Pantoea sp. Brub]|nr:lipopolysaccharide heptosyltransferase RfaC [Pantoea sp. Brub]
MRVLIVKLSSMGDIIHCFPALTDAMYYFPNIRFDWVIEEDFAEIPRWHIAVNNIITVSIRRWKNHWFNAQIKQERLLCKTLLQSRTYDAVIDAQGLIKSAMFITQYSNGIKHGYDVYSARECFASWWYDKRHRISKKQHAIERIRELFAKSLGYLKPKTVGNYNIDKYLKNIEYSPKYEYKYLIFLHSSTCFKKQWPEEHWKQLIQFLEKSGLRIKLPWKLKHEYQRAKRLAKNFDHVDILPKLNIETLAKYLNDAFAIVSVDTGLSHLAAALNKPNITLYGPSNPALIGRYGKNQYSLISPNYNLNYLSYKVVANKLLEIIECNNIK